MVPNRITLKSRGRLDEAPAGTELFPGMLLLENSSGAVIAHGTAGALAAINIAEEDANQGNTILDALTSGDTIPFRRGAKGDVFLVLLQDGQNVSRGAQLMSAGDGTLIVNPGEVLANITAPSANITNIDAETTFSNGSYTIPANFLKVGDVVRIRAKAFCSGQNGTDTHRVKAYIGATALADSTALALDPNDWVMFEIALTIRTIGASGTFIADGYMTTVVATVITTTSFTVVSTAVDTTATQAITIKSDASAASAGNIIRLDEFLVELNRAGGLHTLFRAEEAINNSAGSGEYVAKSIADAEFIRASVL